MHAPDQARTVTSMVRAPAWAAVAGFTLLEVLLVVFIIGLMAGFAVLSIDDRASADRLEAEARRLEALLRTASEEAVLYGDELGFSATRDGYRFMRLGQDGWQVVQGSDNPLRQRKLDQGIDLRLLEGDPEDRRVTRATSAAADPASRPDDGADERDDDARNQDDEESHRPQVLFLSSGELTPFRLEMTMSGLPTRYVYEGELTGKLRMERRDAHAER